MSTHHQEITTYLISEEAIKQRLGSIFVDSIVLKTDFSIEVVSKNLEELLEFTIEELRHKPIDYIGSEIRRQVEDHLNHGYFEDLTVELNTKSNVGIQVNLSGFYLGLISDINGYIILKIKLPEDHILQKELYKKTRELDSFIYRTAHDLRGPLATVKGLINLMKIRRDNDEIDELIRLVEIHAEKLDDRLHKLVYLADTHEVPSVPKGCLNFLALETSLRATLENNYQDITLEMSAPEAVTEIEGVNEFLATALMNNLFLYALSLPLKERGFLKVDLSIKKDFLRVEIRTFGFIVSEHVRKAIRQSTFLYNDMLTYPLLVNYFAAQKVAMQLNTFIKIDFRSDEEQEFFLSIPIQKSC